MVVKTICDWGDGNKTKDWQPWAAHVAAKFVAHAFGEEGQLVLFEDALCVCVRVSFSITHMHTYTHTLSQSFCPSFGATAVCFFFNFCVA